MDFILFQNTYLYLIAAGLAAGMLVVHYRQAERGLSPAQTVSLSNSKDAVLIDVRPAEQYQEGTIGKAIHIPMDQLKARAATLPQDKRIIIIDADGRHASRAARVLNQAGLTDVHWLKQGIAAWVKDSLPLKKPGTSKRTKKI